MKYYVKLDKNKIAIEFYASNKVIADTLEVNEKEAFNILGKRWNGKTFEEVPTEEVEAPETTEVTNADLLEVLLAIGEKVGA